MKHNIKITIILLLMFIMTQFIGLYVSNYYSPKKVIDGVVINKTASPLPYGLGTPEIAKENDFYNLLPSIVFAFIFAIFLFFFLTKFKLEFVIKAWFFIVVSIALGIAFNSILTFNKHASLIALVFAIPLAFIKIYRRNFVVHNATELFIYPGIASVFIPIFNIWTIVIFLIIISIYDIWAVWHSGIMQKMAKYQIDKLNIFSGFFIPYLSKKVKFQLSRMKKANIKNKKIKVNVAILGGGDIVFPIVTSGIVLNTGKIFLPYSNIQIFQGGLIPALFVLGGATLGLAYLFFISEKKKFYPAMPFITLGIFLGFVLSRIFI